MKQSVELSSFSTSFDLNHKKNDLFEYQFSRVTKVNKNQACTIQDPVLYQTNLILNFKF